MTEVIDVSDQIMPQIDPVEELKKKIDHAQTEQAKKIDAAWKHFDGSCNVAAAKYLTVNGYMQVREVLKECDWTNMAPNAIHSAAIIMACKMSELVLELKEACMCNMEYQEILDGKLDKEFCKQDPEQIITVDIAYQIEICNILQQIDDSLDSIKSFYDSTTDEILKMKAELANLTGE